MITLLTMHELQGFTDQELDALHELYLTLLMETDLETPDRRHILATLENVRRHDRLALWRHEELAPSIS